jgi:hypothetical protein
MTVEEAREALAGLPQHDELTHPDGTPIERVYHVSEYDQNRVVVE